MSGRVMLLASEALIVLAAALGCLWWAYYYGGVWPVLAASVLGAVFGGLSQVTFREWRSQRRHRRILDRLEREVSKSHHPAGRKLS